eukprot:2060488-Pyramimonas_sp.AAC.1
MTCMRNHRQCCCDMCVRAARRCVTLRDARRGGGSDIGVCVRVMLGNYYVRDGRTPIKRATYRADMEQSEGIPRKKSKNVSTVHTELGSAVADVSPVLSPAI